MKRRYIIPVFATLLVLSINTQSQDPDPEWAKRNGWGFYNFGIDSLPWSIYRETFIGVAPDPSADFDLFLYHSLYKTELSRPGLCYGMCVMALMMKKNGGHLGYCCPAHVYSPDDPNLETALAIMHGYQINHSFLTFALDVIAANKIRDGNYAFAKVQEFLAKNDPPIICFSETEGGIFGSKGHCIIPYACTGSGANKKIWVYDPNRSWYGTGADGRDWYTNHNNFISVNEATGSWSFVMAGGTTWSGNPSSGGRIITAPLSVTGRKDRLPQSLFAEAAYTLNSIIIFAGLPAKKLPLPVPDQPKQ